MRRLCGFFGALLFVSFAGIQGETFYDDAITIDEDIFNKVLPRDKSTGITVPGTKWCGPGNNSRSYNDLGTQIAADKCCRSHDYCPDIIASHETKYELPKNTDLFPILHCSCEWEFIKCLKAVNNMISNSLGRIYYTNRSRCFDRGYPIVDCKEYQAGTFRQRCLAYNTDKKRSKIWQYYDLPYYGKLDKNWTPNTST